MNSGNFAPDHRTRARVAALLCLFLAYILLSGLMPLSAAAQSDIPIQLQAVCHTGPGPVPITQEQPEAPDQALPCCVMCCGMAHQGAVAPPPVAALGVVAEPELVGRIGFQRHLPTLRNHDALPPQARAPPALT